MQYKLSNNFPGVIKTDDYGIISCVPNNPANSDWQAYQAWLAADPSNQPLPADS